MRRLLAVTMAVTLALAACGGDDETTESGDPTTTAAADATTTTGDDGNDGDGGGDGATTTTASDGIDPMEDAGIDPVHRGADAGAETALLTDVRVARHEGFDRGGFEDRKSTRMNSSHDNISYAVFCL